IDGPFRDRQSEARPAFLARTGFVDAIKPIKDAVAMFCRDPRPFVGDRDNRLGLRRLDADAYLRSRWTVFDRVIHDVEDGLAEYQRICTDWNGVSTVDDDPLAALLGEDEQ